ncbi:MAG: HD domain-containing phosphohydrolase [Fimbriimonas sp.]
MAKILVVDDVAVNRQLLVTLFGYKGHTLYEAGDGAEAMRLIEAHLPDLVVTDIVMPNVDGYELLRLMRADPRFSLIQVVVYTATYLEGEARELARRAGAYCVLRRPAEAEHLLRVMEAALSAPVPVVEQMPDEAFEIEHRRLLMDKLAQKVAELEEAIAFRKLSEERMGLALGASKLQVWDWDIRASTMTLVSTGTQGPAREAEVETVPFESTFETIHPADRAGVRAAIDEARRSGSPYSIRYRIATSDGGFCAREAKGRFQYDSDGNAVRAVGTLADITELLAAEEERSLLAALVVHSPDLIASSTLEGRQATINPAGRRMIGFEESPRPHDVIENVYEEDVSLVRDVVWPVTLAQGVWKGEIRFKDHRSGNPIPCDCHVFVIKNAEGAVRNFAVIARDITRRKITQRELAERLAQLTAFRRIDTVIASTADLRLTLEIVAREVEVMPDVQRAQIFLCDAYDHHLEPTAPLPESFVSLTGLAERAIRTRQRADTERKDGSVAGVAVPLIAKGFVKGVLAVEFVADPQRDGGLLRFLETLAGQLAVTIDGALLFEDLQRSRADIIAAYDEALEGWSRALDLRDKETEGHSRRVTELTMRMARAMNVPSSELPHIRRGALLHDIGKIAVPDAILLKPGPLTPEERQTMQKHADHAFELLAPIEFLRPALDIPYCHHEKWDGTGYPRGLKGKQIPLAARIFALADVWDALRSDRPYRAGWSFDQALTHMRSLSGTHFDPEVLAIFCVIVEEFRDSP